MTGATPPSAAKSQTYVELSFSCENLRDMDVLSKSDPQVTLVKSS